MNRLWLWCLILTISVIQGCEKVTFKNTLFRLSIDEVGDFSKYERIDGCITPISVTSRVSIIECYNQSVPILKEGAITNMPEVTTLVFTGNEINKMKRATFTNLPKLTELILSNNKLQMIEVGVFSLLPSVSRLLLDGNQLTFLDEGIFTNMPNLRQLILAKNQLDSIEQEWFDLNSEVSVLSLSHNLIRRVSKDAFKRIKKLEILDLSHNQILTIHESAFEGLTNLYNVDLGNNNLIQLTGNLFGPLQNLETLYLHANNLTYIHTKVLKGISLSLQEISIYSNPWQCACYNDIMNWASRDSNLKIDYSVNCRVALSPVCAVPLENPDKCLEDTIGELDNFYKAFNYENKTCDLSISY